MKCKCLIVDDEPLARKLIVSHISKIEGLVPVGECNDAFQAGNFLRTHQVDLMFLDIQMPEINGLQFINTLKNSPAIIFTTAFRDFAPEAFELDAIDYLIKPISFERLVKAVNKFFERKADAASKPVQETDGAEFIFMKANRKIHKILLSEIHYLESMDEYVKVHLKGRMLLTRENITTLERKLSGPSFVRIHRSFIVSTKAVSSISSDGVEVEGKLIPFGRAFKLSALAALGMGSK